MVMVIVMVMMMVMAMIIVMVRPTAASSVTTAYVASAPAEAVSAPACLKWCYNSVTMVSHGVGVVLQKCGMIPCYMCYKGTARLTGVTSSSPCSPIHHRQQKR
jgi:hypothetical protein